MNPTVDLKTLLGLVIRTAIVTYGGALITNPADAEILAGGILILGAGVWSYFQKRSAAKKIAAATQINTDL